MKNKILLACLLLFTLAGTAQEDKRLFFGTPVFHGAQLIGNYPNTPFLFAMPVTGSRPMQYSAVNLPKGLALDEKTGFITGNIQKAGTYKVTLVAVNQFGKTTEDVTIVIGDKLCLTPPMGWNSWNVFTSAISEQLLMEMADAMASNGMRDLGYQYINIDDFWHASEREADGRPKVDSVKFPHGMKYLADYVHSKGLKLGIYSCAGDKTCGKCFGGYAHEEIDAKAYAEWGIDLLKYDYCFAPWGRKAAIERYTKMGTALRNSGRSIVFSVCEWGLRKPWLWAEKAGGHYWRTTPDIFDTWNHGNPFQMSVMRILKKQRGLEKYAGPGHWNDPDMLLVGNHGKGRATSSGGLYKGLTQEEYKSHFALWCMMSAPLLVSCDLRSISKEDFEIITDADLIAVDQNPAQIPGRVIKKHGKVWEYAKTVDTYNWITLYLNTSTKPKADPASATQSIPAHGVSWHRDSRLPDR